MNIKFLTVINSVVLSFAMVLLSGYANAVVPNSMPYQGYLSDNNGTALNSAVNVTFSLYTVDSGGVPVWSMTQSITPVNGLFNVELGGAGHPFVPGIFDTPLWLGISVDTDAEMLPRKPVTTQAFSYKADDADSVGGMTSSQLDQSAHVVDVTNPHNVTAAQVGAAGASELIAHTSNTTNPHNVTAGQVGAVTYADVLEHVSYASAHHSRYSNGEAVAAMGATTDGNPLNHTKYTDANAVAAIIANDGAGSTLDADLVDGLQASEIIDAAQDEVRTPISSLPYTISQPGSYYLTGNLNGASGGIDIIASDVTLDLMGFTINGGGTVNDYGINFNARSNITIKNGTVRNFGLAGIYQASSTARYATVTDINVLGNGSGGTSNLHSGIFIFSSNSHVERCISGDNGGHGIYVYASSKLINNTAYNNLGDYGIFGAYGSSLIGNTASFNQGGYGIYSGSASNLTLNTASFNQGYGIYSGSGSNLTSNTVYNNQARGIYAANGSSITNNSVFNNGHSGIYATGSNIVKDNTVYTNNLVNHALEGGLYIITDSRVVGNILDGNNVRNLYIHSSGNTIESNTLTDSTNGIFFYSSGNFYGNNRASGNTTNFNLNGTTQTTNTYLPNISY